MIGGKRFAVVRQDLLGFAVAGKRLVECGACVGAVFGQLKRFSADIESAGVVDDLVDGDLGVSNVVFRRSKWKRCGEFVVALEWGSGSGPCSGALCVTG